MRSHSYHVGKGLKLLSVALYQGGPKIEERSLCPPQSLPKDEGSECERQF